MEVDEIWTSLIVFNFAVGNTERASVIWSSFPPAFKRNKTSINDTNDYALTFLLAM